MKWIQHRPIHSARAWPAVVSQVCARHLVFSLNVHTVESTLCAGGGNSVECVLQRLSVICPAGPKDELVMRQITLHVTSALDGVGLTAAVATALSELGIPANVVAGHFHDHVFVPEDQAVAALAALKNAAQHAD